MSGRKKSKAEILQLLDCAKMIMATEMLLHPKEHNTKEMVSAIHQISLFQEKLKKIRIGKK